jgi:hypothetical protein
MYKASALLQSAKATEGHQPMTSGPYLSTNESKKRFTSACDTCMKSLLDQTISHALERHILRAKSTANSYVHATMQMTTHRCNQALKEHATRTKQ